MADGFVGVAASKSVSVEDWASSSGSRSNDDVTGEGASRGSLLEEGILASLSAEEVRRGCKLAKTRSWEEVGTRIRRSELWLGDLAE